MIVKTMIKAHERALDTFEREREKLLFKYKNENLIKNERVMLEQQIQHYGKLIVRENKFINKLVGELKGEKI